MDTAPCDVGIGPDQNRTASVELTQARPGALDILTIAPGANDDDINGDAGLLRSRARGRSPTGSIAEERPSPGPHEVVCTHPHAVAGQYRMR